MKGTLMGLMRGGLDEVGWGALAGPIISCVAVFNDDTVALMPSNVRDSKKTTLKTRESMFLPLCRFADDVGIGHAWPWEIDQYGPFPALQLSYKRALNDLKNKPDVLIVDGSHRVDAFKGKQTVEPKADVNHPQVSAASMIAKFFRDRIMRDYEISRKMRGLPGYNWDQNCGYGTPDHIEAIQKNGLLISWKDSSSDHSNYIHRMKYCRKLMAKKS